MTPVVQNAKIDLQKPGITQIKEPTDIVTIASPGILYEVDLTQDKGDVGTLGQLKCLNDIAPLTRCDHI